MPISLHEATVPAFLQILSSTAGLLDKASTYCDAHGVEEAVIAGLRLAPDMYPFAYQVRTATTFSAGAIEGVKRGAMNPDLSPPPESLAPLKRMVADAISALEASDPDEVDALIGREMFFQVREKQFRFTADAFLLSFAVPNFYFHTATAYDLLRLKGLSIGKRDYLGAFRVSAE